MEIMPYTGPGSAIRPYTGPGSAIMPYTGPGSAIVPKPTTIPPPRVPFGPQPFIGPPKPPGLPGGGGGPRVPFGPQPLIGPPKPPGLGGGGAGGAAAAATAPALARFIGPAFLALMGVDMLSRAGQSRRQKEMMLQQMGMMGLTGGAQYGDQLGALAMGQNYSNVIGGMGALAEGAQIPSASELELALLLGKSGAAAAQKAAVAPQMDELALDYVLGMT